MLASIEVALAAGLSTNCTVESTKQVTSRVWTKEHETPVWSACIQNTACLRQRMTGPTRPLSLPPLMLRANYRTTSIVGDERWALPRAAVVELRELWTNRGPVCSEQEAQLSPRRQGPCALRTATLGPPRLSRHGWGGFFQSPSQQRE
jgi:hypothetical protein